MEKEFIPYTESLALKELGFDEGCFSLYFNNGEFSNFIHSFTVNSEVVEKTSSILAPTFSQAFRWFREKYVLFAEITLCGDGLGYISMIKEIKQEEFIEVYKKDIVDTLLPIWKYEEAELECLKKLIEIVKNK